MRKYLNKQNIARLIVFVWPFIFLLPYAVSGMEWSKMIVLDIHDFYFPKVFLLNSLAEGRFPLWSPAEGVGFPFYTSPFNQAFYPLNFPLVLYYKLTGGFSWFDYQRYSILGISMFAVFLYNLLLRFKIDWKSALLATLIVSVSFKTLGMLNRASAEHGLAWMTSIMWGMTMMASVGERKKAFLTISISFFFFITNFYPYYLYYSIFLFAFTFLLVIISKLRWQLLGIRKLAVFQYFLGILGSFLLPLLICLPFLWQVAIMQSLVTARTGGGSSYIRHGGFSLYDTLGSWVFPPTANSLGWYYFGAMAFLLIGLYLSSFLWKKHLESKSIIVVVLGFGLIVTLVSYSNTFWFDWLIDYVPGFKNFKSWSRFNLLLLPFVAFLLAKSFRFFMDLVPNLSKKSSIKEKQFTKLSVSLLLITLVGLSIQLYLHFYIDNSYLWKLLLAPQIPDFNQLIYPLFLVLAGATLSLFMIYGRISPSLTTSYFELSFIFLLVGFSALDIRYHAIQLRSLQSLGPFEHDIELGNSQLDLEKILLDSFDNPREYDPYRTFNSVWLFRKGKPAFSARPGMSWWFASYQRLAKENSEVIPRPMWKKLLIFREGMKKLTGMKDGKKIFLSPDIRYELNEVNEFLKDSQRKEKQARFSYKVVSYNGDYLKVKIESLDKGFLSFIDNDSPWWYARIDGELVEIDRLFNTFKSVPIERGIHEVEFYFSPPLFGALRATPRLKNDVERMSLSDGQTLFDSYTKELFFPVQWQNTYGLTEINGKYYKEGRTLWGYSGASSKQIASAEQDLSLDIDLAADNFGVIVGLSTEDTDFGYEKMEIGVHLSEDHELRVYQKGRNQKIFRRFNNGDKLNIRRINGYFICSLNNEVFFVAQETNTKTLLIDTALRKEDAAIPNIASSF